MKTKKQIEKEQNRARVNLFLRVKNERELRVTDPEMDDFLQRAKLPEIIAANEFIQAIHPQFNAENVNDIAFHVVAIFGDIDTMRDCIDA